MADRVDGYAAAILEVARAEGSLDAVSDELFQFALVLQRSDQLRQTLTDQSLPPDKRQAIVEDLLGPKASPLTVQLISFVVVAEVRTAVDLDDEQRRRLTEALERATGKKIELKVIRDPTVIGGVVARVGDTVIDGTVRHRLEQLREAL